MSEMFYSNCLIEAFRVKLKNLLKGTITYIPKAGGGGGGLQNLSTGTGSLSILGAATTSSYSVSIGYNANASDFFSTAIGYEANASGFFSTALGDNATASGDCSTALGDAASVSGNYSTAIGRKATTTETGVTVISAWDDSGEAKTQLYLIGAGSTMSTTYCDGEAGLGFMSKDSSGNILKRGTIKLSALCTENTDTFEPS